MDSLENLTDKIGLLVGDYFQKVLPMAFREGQYSYFGKGGMTLHSDVLLLKRNNQIQKHTYFTTAYRSDNGTADFLTIADYVIKQIERDISDIIEPYCKSDSAGAYHSNFYPQGISVRWN